MLLAQIFKRKNSAIYTKELLIHTTWLNLERIMLCVGGGGLIPKDFMLYESI